MKALLTSVIGILLLVFVSSWFYLKTYSYPNIYLSAINVGNKSRQEIEALLRALERQRLKIKVKNRVYTFTYKNLGVFFDKEKTKSLIFTDNNLPFPRNYLSFYNALFSQKMFLPVVLFGDEFYQRFQSLEFDFSKAKDRVELDVKNKSLVFKENQDVYKIDPENLQTQIVINFGQKKTLEPKLIRLTDVAKKQLVQSRNESLQNIYKNPVAVHIFRNGGYTTVFLTVAELKQLLTVAYDEVSDKLSVGVDSQLLRELITAKTASLVEEKDISIDFTDFEIRLVSLVNSRFNGYVPEYVVAHVVRTPNTNGDYAAKYIEIDLSQQTMYLWENGKNISQHRISSGLYYPTPPGEYAILNKALNAYSDIYHVWMPYWMAFSLDRKVNAYLGIHELPYWIDNQGQEIRRPRDFIGSPHTGGCISLDIGEAAKVFAWAEVGTPVVIYE